MARSKVFVSYSHEDKKWLQKLRPFLKTVYSLDTETPQRDVAALKQTIEWDLGKLLEDLGRPGGPSHSTVCQCFKNLLGQELSTDSNTRIEADVDRVVGSLGKLRDVCGLGFGRFVVTIDDERNVTNFRIVVDYIASLRGAGSTI
jgi:hypothetical protein